jgi:MerR family transcriptional regulator, mercuric resistance operon regulatory protein
MNPTGRADHRGDPGAPDPREPRHHPAGLRSSQLADAAGVNRQTLRYYERRGLLAEPRRSLGGHRIYPAETVTVLKVIKAAQRLGFTLDQVTDLLAATSHRTGRTVAHGTAAQVKALASDNHPNTDLRHQAREKLAEVETRIADLQTIATTLRATVEAGCDDLITCAAQPPCPIPFNPPDPAA